MAVRNPSLRAVEPGEKAPPRPRRAAKTTSTADAPASPKTVTEAAEQGNTLAEMRHMRLRIAKAIDDPKTPARDLAALTRRQMEIGREIDAHVARLNEERQRGTAVPDASFAKEAI